MLTVGVCQEYLPEGITTHHVHNLFHTLCVEFVKDIIEQQDGSGFGTGALEKSKLCQLQCNHKGLVME